MRMAFDWFASLPNLITIGRLLLTPVTIVMIEQRDWRAAFALFVIGSVSDAVDGWLAKTYRLQSDLGAMLDPIADKALIVSVYVTLGVVGALPAWLVIMIVSRDLMIVGGMVISWLLSHPMAIHPHLVSKATTAVQLLLAAVVLARAAFGLEPLLIEPLLIALVAALTMASASVYLWLWVQHMRP